MQLSSTDFRTLALSAYDAMQNGEAARARELFDKIVASGRADTSVWMGMAAACRQLADRAGEIAALDQALERDPTNLQALLRKGDFYLEDGDHRAGVAFYQSALKRVPAPDRLTAALRDDLRRAQKACEEYGLKFEAFLHSELTAHGFDPETSSRRFAQSLDLMKGTKRIYHQQPRHYYFPELPQIQFYERSLFPWMDAVEAATDDIRKELLGVLEGPNVFTPYVEHYESRPNIDPTGMIDNADWTAYFLWKNGEVVPEHAQRCPKTMAALKDVPLCRIARRTPSILFSQLRPGAKIPPHNGMINARLICHLPLIVPEKCQFRVGNETRAWVEGKAFAFDDTIEHEASNGSDKRRVVLIFDIWRPELTQKERELVTTTIEAVDAYSGRQDDWQA